MLTGGSVNLCLSGRIAMSALLLFTAIGHLVYLNGMSLMIPSFIPYKKAIIMVTGIIEMATAAGLLIPKLQLTTAWLLIIFLIVILPANIQAARKNIDYQKGNTNGNGLKYLWFRIPLQILFIVWTYYFAIYLF